MSMPYKKSMNNSLGLIKLQKQFQRKDYYQSMPRKTETKINSRPFSRKPQCQTDQTILSSSRVSQNSVQNFNQNILLKDNQSIRSGKSNNLTKFIRTSKMEFHSPKSKTSFSKDFSSQKNLNSQSQCLNIKDSRLTLKDNIIQKLQTQSSSSQDSKAHLLQKSSSTNQFFHSQNKTRKMILSKFTTNNTKESKQTIKYPKNVNTSIHQRMQEQYKQQQRNSQKNNQQLRNKNSYLQRQVANLKRINDQLKCEKLKLKIRVQQLVSANQYQKQQRTKMILSSSSSSNTSPIQSQISIISRISNTNTQKLSKDQSNLNIHYIGNPSSLKSILQKQTMPNSQQKLQKNKNSKQKIQTNKKYQQKIQINKKYQSQKPEKCESCIKLPQLTQKLTQIQNELKIKTQSHRLSNQTNSLLQKQIQQLKVHLEKSRQQQTQWIQTQQRLQNFIHQLKQQLNYLHDQLKYINIQNSVLLKIKNQNLKLKINITKVTDERDYFKIKIAQMRKKINANAKNQVSKFIQEQKKKRTTSCIFNKRFYLDSTQTDDHQESRVYKNKNTNQNTNYDIYNKNVDNIQTIFDLTSQDSQTTNIDFTH